MENLGLQDDGNQDDKSDTKYSIEDTKYGIEDTKYDSDDVTSSPELKRRRLMSDSSSSHTEDPAETFGSPEPPIQMPVPDIKKEFDATEGIMMPTDPKAESRRLSDGDKTGTIEAAEFEADKGAGASEEAPKEEKSKEELAQEERQKMQVLVSSFSEEQLNRYEMYRRSSFPKAAIKRTDGNTGQTRVTHPSPHSVTHSSSQPTTISSYSQNVPESTQPPGRLSQTQTSAQQSIKQEPGVAPPGIAALNPNAALQQALGVAPPGIATLNPNSALGVAPPGNEAVNSNAALQQVLSALQPLLLQSGAFHPGLQPNLSSLFQTQPMLPIQQLIPTPYQPTPSTTVFVLPQPNPVQPATETVHHNHPQHKNCCPGCLTDIQELRRLVDLIIRANTNPLIQTPTANLNPLIQTQGANLNPLIQTQAANLNPLIQTQAANLNPLTQQQHHATSALLQQQLQQATSALNTTIPINNPNLGLQRLIENPSIFNPVVSEPAQIPASISPQPHASNAAVQKRTGSHSGDNLNRLMPTSARLSSRLDEVSHPGQSHHQSNSREDRSRGEESLWKSRRGKNTMEQIQNRLQPDPLNPSQYVVKEEVLHMLKQKSDDRQFIARRLANLLFTKQERRISNCHGRRHKRPLDPVRLDAIKRAVFKINPLIPDNGAMRATVWKQCCASIDMSSRSYMQSITGCSASQNVVIAMSGIAKVFVGEIVEESLDAMDQWGESGPLQPKHIREAVRRLKAHDKIPTATYKHTLFK